MTLPLALEILTAVLVVLSGLFTLLGAMGVLWLPTFFDRQHAPALAYSAGAWCAGLAAVAHFARVDGYSGLKALYVAILLALAVPVTNMMLARAGLFRERWQARAPEPKPSSEFASHPEDLPAMLQPAENGEPGRAGQDGGTGKPAGKTGKSAS